MMAAKNQWWEVRWLSINEPLSSETVKGTEAQEVMRVYRIFKRGKLGPGAFL